MGVELGNYSSTNIEATGSVVDNQIQVRRRGILYNLMYAPGFTYPVIGNTITATPDDLTLGGSVWAGVYMMTQQGNVMPTFQGNTINASGSNYATTAGYVATYVDSTATALISGGSVSNVTYGVWEDSQDPNYFSSIDSNVALTVSGVSISASTYGVYVHDTSSTYSVAAAIENNTSITTTGGSGTGVFVSGAKASATISGNHIYDNGTGIEFTAGGGGALSGNNFAFGSGSPATDNGTDLLIASTAGTVTIGDGNAFAGTTDYIQNLSSQNFNLSGYTTTTFSGFNAATTAVSSGNLASFYGVENEIVDALDNASYGYVKIAGGYDFVAQESELPADGGTAGAIQRDQRRDLRRHR